MVERGRPDELTWQGQPLFPRPPGAIWPAAVGTRLFGDERAARVPLAIACALEIGLLMLYGAQRFGPLGGAVAGLALLTADLFLGYARYYESEPFLCVWVLGALVCYEGARRRPALIYGYGAFLALALMTKQVVGALPLVALAEDRPANVGRALLLAALLFLPWHLWMVARHGREFLDVYLFHSVLGRSTAPLLRTTRATFYLRELLRSDPPLLAGAAFGLVCALPCRQGRDLFLAGWALGVIAIYSAVRSRYDYYLLLAYPALALLFARAVVAGPGPRLVRGLLGAALLGWAAVAHLPHHLGRLAGDEEVRALAQAVPSGARRLYLYNTHPYSARYYAQVDVTTLLESPLDYQKAQALVRTGMPAPVELATDLPARLRDLERPYALLFPRARLPLLDGVEGLRPIGETAHYRLYAVP
jgi:4-amino-4-deoxy-L-arabinose transferase-like glycosyltransferase